MCECFVCFPRLGRLSFAVVHAAPFAADGFARPFPTSLPVTYLLYIAYAGWLVLYYISGVHYAPRHGGLVDSLRQMSVGILNLERWYVRCLARFSLEASILIYFMLLYVSCEKLRYCSSLEYCYTGVDGVAQHQTGLLRRWYLNIFCGANTYMLHSMYVMSYLVSLSR